MERRSHLRKMDVVHTAIRVALGSKVIHFEHICRSPMNSPNINPETPNPGTHPIKVNAADLAAFDDKLSKRFIELDPAGYFLIYLDREAGLICAKHFSNIINDKGLACDPVTGKPLPTKGKSEREPTAIFTGRTAKDLCIQIFEKTKPAPLTFLDHAAYLGREFLRAEIALINGTEYVQD
jgi:dihydropteroate synthase